MHKNRGEWSNHLGFILAAAGSAVGLGNIWKFPGKLGANGGGLFLLIFIGIRDGCSSDRSEHYAGRAGDW